jgi:ribosomal protein S18 acetylase RimI-like enzyme
MTPADFPVVFRLWQITEGIGLNESDKPEAFAAFLTRNPGMSQVALAGTEIVGTLMCGHDGRRGYLHHLAVAQAHRHQGLGRTLVEKCLRVLAAQGIAKCNIYLFADNPGGRTFWAHNGWDERAEIQVLQKRVAATRVAVNS